MHIFQGISAWSRSVDAFKTALECLPQEKSTEAEKQMRIAFTESLTTSQKALDTPVSPEKMTYVTQGQKLPWQKAEALEKELLDSHKPSSVRYISKFLYGDLSLPMFSNVHPL